MLLLPLPKLVPYELDSIAAPYMVSSPPAAARKQLLSSRRFSTPVESFSAIRSARSPTCNWPAYALTRDTTKAKAAYQDFLIHWKNADPGILLLKQARAEYAKLQ